ncbi:hypothetical protein BV898_03187 [Hypsibius exemplaris]|uniref:Uncharacterized protein n=1 Tax=Hypsibius exemplaris TaxID=2072580 RepID=A0A1W0X5R9_HYPEX|nr:hypothetical protein BV898_03187 [Hypsibius exemplaris]
MRLCSFSYVRLSTIFYPVVQNPIFHFLVKNKLVVEPLNGGIDGVGGLSPPISDAKMFDSSGHWKKPVGEMKTRRDNEAEPRAWDLPAWSCYFHCAHRPSFIPEIWIRHMQWHLKFFKKMTLDSARIEEADYNEYFKYYGLATYDQQRYNVSPTAIMAIINELYPFVTKGTSPVGALAVLGELNRDTSEPNSAETVAKESPVKSIVESAVKERKERSPFKLHMRGVNLPPDFSLSCPRHRFFVDDDDKEANGPAFTVVPSVQDTVDKIVEQYSLSNNDSSSSGTYIKVFDMSSQPIGDLSPASSLSSPAISEPETVDIRRKDIQSKTHQIDFSQEWPEVLHQLRTTDFRSILSTSSSASCSKAGGTEDIQSERQTPVAPALPVTSPNIAKPISLSGKKSSSWSSLAGTSTIPAPPSNPPPCFLPRSSIFTVVPEMVRAIPTIETSMRSVEGTLLQPQLSKDPWHNSALVGDLDAPYRTRTLREIAPAKTEPQPIPPTGWNTMFVPMPAQKGPPGRAPVKPIVVSDAFSSALGDSVPVSSEKEAVAETPKIPLPPLKSAKSATVSVPEVYCSHKSPSEMLIDDPPVVQDDEDEEVSQNTAAEGMPVNEEEKFLRQIFEHNPYLSKHALADFLKDASLVAECEWQSMMLAHGASSELFPQVVYPSGGVSFSGNLEVNYDPDHTVVASASVPDVVIRDYYVVCGAKQYMCSGCNELASTEAAIRAHVTREILDSFGKCEGMPASDELVTNSSMTASTSYEWSNGGPSSEKTLEEILPPRPKRRQRALRQLFTQGNVYFTMLKHSRRMTMKDPGPTVKFWDLPFAEQQKYQGLAEMRDKIRAEVVMEWKIDPASVTSFMNRKIGREMSRRFNERRRALPPSDPLSITGDKMPKKIRRIKRNTTLRSAEIWKNHEIVEGSADRGDLRSWDIAEWRCFIKCHHHPGFAPQIWLRHMQIHLRNRMKLIADNSKIWRVHHDEYFKYYALASYDNTRYHVSPSEVMEVIRQLGPFVVEDYQPRQLLPTTSASCYANGPGCQTLRQINQPTSAASSTNIIPASFLSTDCVGVPLPSSVSNQLLTSEVAAGSAVSDTVKAHKSKSANSDAARKLFFRGSCSPEVSEPESHRPMECASYRASSSSATGADQGEVAETFAEPPVDGEADVRDQTDDTLLIEANANDEEDKAFLAEVLRRNPYVSREKLLHHISDPGLIAEEEAAADTLSAVMMHGHGVQPDSSDQEFVDFTVSDADRADSEMTVRFHTGKMDCYFTLMDGERFRCGLCGAVIAPLAAALLHVAEDLLHSLRNTCESCKQTALIDLPRNEPERKSAGACFKVGELPEPEEGEPDGRSRIDCKAGYLFYYSSHLPEKQNKGVRSVKAAWNLLPADVKCQWQKLAELRNKIRSQIVLESKIEDYSFATKEQKKEIGLELKKRFDVARCTLSLPFPEFREKPPAKLRRFKKSSGEDNTTAEAVPVLDRDLDIDQVSQVAADSS